MERANLFFLLTMSGACALGCTPDETDDAAATTGTDEGTTSADDGTSTAATSEPGSSGSTSSDTAAGESESGTDDPDGTDTDSESGEPPPASGCESFYASYDACHPEYAGEGDCDFVFESFPDDETCVTALDDYYGCLSQLDCQTMDTLDGFPCRTEFEMFSASCGDSVGSCQAGSGSGDLDATACETSLFNCLDDNAYAFECETSASGDTVECSCTVNGEPSGTTTLETSEAWCAGEDLAAALATDCGWPEGVASLVV